MGMIFVPSVGGISHSPRELTKPEDVVNGANVLLNAVIAADRA
jgi:N-carbamoyl-L-amino-acid hydrolase